MTSQMKSTFIVLGLLALTRMTVAAPTVGSPAATTVSSPEVGVVDDSRLMAERQDFIVLANKVLPAIAKQKKLKMVVRKSGVMWSSTLKTVDITNEVLLRVRALAKTLPAPPDVNSLNATQWNDANRAVTALRKLDSGLEQGDSLTSYSARLANQRAEVESSLRALPSTNTVSIKINGTLKAYVDIYETWNGLTRLIALDDERIQMIREDEDRAPLTEGERLARRFRREKEDVETTRKQLEPVTNKWAVGKKALLELEGLLQKEK